MQQVLTEGERARLRELHVDTRAALAMGLTLDEYRQQRDEDIGRWCDFLHAKMDELHANDPTEILPQLAVAIEQRCASESRRIAEATARQVVERMLRKAIA
jgi:hypothetical protein